MIDEGWRLTSRLRSRRWLHRAATSGARDTTVAHPHPGHPAYRAQRHAVRPSHGRRLRADGYHVPGIRRRSVRASMACIGRPLAPHRVPYRRGNPRVGSLASLLRVPRGRECEGHREPHSRGKSGGRVRLQRHVLGEHCHTSRGHVGSAVGAGTAGFLPGPRHAGLRPAAKRARCVLWELPRQQSGCRTPCLRCGPGGLPDWHYSTCEWGLWESDGQHGWGSVEQSCYAHVSAFLPYPPFCILLVARTRHCFAQANSPSSAGSPISYKASCTAPTSQSRICITRPRSCSRPHLRIRGGRLW